MPAVRLSTGQPVIVRCSEQLGRRLGMLPWVTEDGVVGNALEAHPLIFPVNCTRPHSPLMQAYLWPAQPGLKAGFEEG